MHERSIVSALAAAASLAACFAASPAAALNAVSYVSGKGADAGVCATPASACRTFAYALTQTKAAGEIKAIDAANYGAAAAGLVINKSITITGVPGAGVDMTALDTAIKVSAGGIGVVTLRNLEINGQGVAPNGIFVQSAKRVYISDVTVRNFTGDGIALGNNGGNAAVTIADSTVTNNGFIGVRIEPPGGASLRVNIEHVTSNDNGHSGFLSSSTAKTTIVDSIAEGNLVDGFRLEGNATGLMILSRSVATANGGGIRNVSAGGVVRSYGDNRVNANTTDTAGTIVLVTPQ
ncbi:MULTISPECIES: right-handed parallel beta-helix repeat-containing protein [Methylosinus]|uniref:Right-handed parallel beta-helix repeat-containing protein n=1 Tax=Methylosinus trichosporium (strain ATCC 35070 / NCIMB 11131 / UNIQEM 75 / OB3b) TaxID=595536 RepID=A0A2D2CZG6_METT3|nr:MULTISPECIES: right-handed parallel beta-helix repeat-containing protein [Methylosinus]ATQ68132.1 right-handed parallel beta-helix repeat-containing protein [Methylosinus trichosporium OB3b]OBS53520.1 hypothetical protein A8B73_05545 [Methylosinus sp. 3S-1]